MNAETIDHRTLSHLLEAGAIRTATAVGQGDRWSLVVHYGNVDKTLQSVNSHQIRTWAKLDSLVKYLRKLGIRKFDTDATNFDPDQISSRKRPDKSEALKRVHAAAEYDKWFREQVQASLDDPRPSLSNNEFKQRMESWLTDKYGARP
ncbi:MAG: hypothetical protein KAU21_11055 [Gammaproteobacteria bacterium]|nr:hypothetical protein [Gammaproteobacteria bacterium]